MRFLIPDKAYWKTGDVTENFRDNILAEAQAYLDQAASADDVDAGPSASIPAVVLEVLSAVADGIAIFAGPIVLVEGLKWWKQRFLAASVFLKERNLDFSIDDGAAILLASEAAYAEGGEAEELQIVSVTRHWFSLNGAWSDHRNFDSDEPDPWLADPHSEAVKQLNVRYIVLLRQGTTGFTAVVEKEGTVSSVYRL